MSNVKSDICSLQWRVDRLEREIKRLDSYYVTDGVCSSQEFSLDSVIRGLIRVTKLKFIKGTPDTLDVEPKDD